MKTYYLFEESKSRRIGADADNFSTTWRFRSTLAFLSTTLDAPASSRPNASESSFDCLSEDDPLATQDCIQPANMGIKTEEPSVEDSPTSNEIEDESLPPVRKRSKESKGMELRTTRIAHRTNFYHYGMTVAQDLDQLDEDFKIDAKLEIMQIIAKYKREQYLNQSNS
ncbi:uncharacterized protein LOC6566433 [Drosophila grimshawi]|uniref:GH13570 n=1 Tax=Drosophila grimshawi TaxID=7222 RepID=B4JPR9_DROGR|nr:uncharacterized protein LOC6566433 [Drosophila grimshawi]EDV98899.1 GH13570 [Drosophila grimshawi]